MKDLTTRKIVLGMLMALVLAFSVQGIADALSFGTTRTGDLQTVFRGNTSPATDSLFTLEFDVTLTGAKEVNPGTRRASQSDINSYTTDATDGYNDSGYSVGTTTHYHINTSSDPDTRTWLTEADAYYYNEQAVTIDPATNIRLVKIGSYNVTLAAGALITLRQTETWPDGRTRLPSGRIRATFAAPTTEATVGSQTISVTDATSTGSDYETGRSAAIFTSFVVYVVKFPADIAANTITSTDAGTNDFQIRYNQPDLRIISTSEASIPIKYQVNGSGRVYVQDGSRIGSMSRELDTSSDAPVFLRMNSGTSRVTLSSPGLRSVTVPYVYGPVSIGKVSGDSPKQIGAYGSRLEDPFVVQVRDASRTGVSGVPVTFTVAGNATPGTLSADPATPVDDVNIASGDKSGTVRD